MIKVQKFNFNLNHLKVNKKRQAIIPFEIVLQTSSKNIEKEIKEQYPELMYSAIRSQAELIEVKKKQLLIRRLLNASKSDIDDIHDYFYDEKWMYPAQKSEGLTDIEITDWEAKIWTDPDIPFLELKGEFIIDIDKTLEVYARKQRIKLKKAGGIRVITEELIIRLIKPFPKALMFGQSQQVYDAILESFMMVINSRGTNFLKKKVEKTLGIKKINSYKKVISWPKPEEIRMEVNDTFKLLGLKGRKSFIPLVGGYIVYRTFRGKK